MNPLAVQKAKVRLASAKRAAIDLKSCDEYESFSGLWYSFLCATKGIYTTLEQGAKASSQSTQWFNTKADERRADPLLQYLYQARNDDEHGVEPVSRHTPGSLGIGVAGPGNSTDFTVTGNFGPGGHITVTSNDGKPVIIQNTPPLTELVAVRGRKGKIFDVPNSHFGKPLVSQMPADVADAALPYFEQLVAEAEWLK